MSALSLFTIQCHHMYIHIYIYNNNIMPMFMHDIIIYYVNYDIVWVKLLIHAQDTGIHSIMRKGQGIGG